MSETTTDTAAARAREIAGRISPCSWADDPAPLCQCSGCSRARRATPIILDAITTDAATIARLEAEVDAFKASALLGEDSAGVTPAHIERHITSLRADVDRLTRAVEEARAERNARARDVMHVEAERDRYRAELDEAVDGHERLVNVLVEERAEHDGETLAAEDAVVDLGMRLNAMEDERDRYRAEVEGLTAERDQLHTLLDTAQELARTFASDILTLAADQGRMRDEMLAAVRACTSRGAGTFADGYDRAITDALTAMHLVTPAPPPLADAITKQ